VDGYGIEEFRFVECDLVRVEICGLKWVFLWGFVFLGENSCVF
jgi:hypothetical protein